MLDTTVVEGVAIDVVDEGTIRVVDEREGTEEERDDQSEDEEDLIELHERFLPRRGSLSVLGDPCVYTWNSRSVAVCTGTVDAHGVLLVRASFTSGGLLRVRHQGFVRYEGVS